MASFVLSCYECGKAITGEHLLLDIPGRGELPCHEECFESNIPVCKWCRQEMTDSYVMYKGKEFGIVKLHEGCKDAFEKANTTTKGDDNIVSLTAPSQLKNAGKNSDRLFIDKMAMRELMDELRRRGVQWPATAEKPRLQEILREKWDLPCVH